MARLPFFQRSFRLTDYRPAPDRDVDAEISFHIASKTEELIQKGYTQKEAEQRAKELFGDSDYVREVCAAYTRTRTRSKILKTFGDDLFFDLRFAMRALKKNPAFLTFAALILGLGIGVNTAIFSVLRTVVLQPLPYPESNRLITVWTPQIGYSFNPMSTPNYLDYQERSESFEAWGAFTNRNVNLAGEERPERIRSIWCTSGLLEALGIQPAMGRLFSEDEEQPTAGKVVLISDSLWRRYYDSDPDIVGRTITVDSESYTVLGIMPAEFEFPAIFYTRNVELLFPLSLTLDEDGRDSHWLWTIGRLKENVTIDQARTDFQSIAASLAEEYPAANTRRIARLVPLTDMVVGMISGGIWVLMVAVGFVLLIACANVASMLMARGVNRQIEIALRASMGASRSRLIRQMLTESLVLAAIGGIVGVLLAWWGVGILRGTIPSSVPRITTLQMDGWILLFCATITLLTGFVFGLLPAFSTSRLNLTRSLHEGGRSRIPGKRQTRLLGTLVVIQFALALVLANSAILLWKSLTNLTGSPELSEPDRVLVAGISLQGLAYEGIEQRNIFWAQMLDRARNLPGVESAGACSQLPFNYGRSGSILAEREEFDPETDHPLTAFTWVTGDYFQAIGVPLLAGRTLEGRDANREDMYIVVNRTLAEHYWPDESAIGKRLRSNSVPQWFEATVVGVVDDFRQWGLEGSVYPEIFFPFNLHTRNERSLVIRTAGDPLSYVSSIRQEVAGIDRNVPLSSVRTGKQLYSDSSAGRRYSTLLFGLFAMLALMLVAAGIYGVMSFHVAHRTHEIGIRMALGAERNRVLRLVIGQGFRLSMVGIAVGLGGSLATASITSSLLFQVSPLNLLSIVGTGLLLTIIGLFSTFIPALRAMVVDPVRAIQTE